jgi:AcrR family transcriptional regulator
MDEDVTRHDRRRRPARGSARQQVLLAATRLFAERGFDGTSVQHIVDAAEVTKGALYHHWRSKEDLLVDIYDQVVQTQLDHLEEIVRRNAPVDERVRSALEDIIETSADAFDEVTVLIRSMHLLGAEQSHVVRARRRDYHERFRSLIEEGQRTGVFRDDVSADVATHHIFGAFNEIPTWWREGGPKDLHAVGREMLNVFMRGLEPR